MERRQILKAGIAVALSPVARVFAQSAGVQKIADDLYIIRIPGEANVVAHTSADGVTLVDGASAVAADALLKEIAALPGNLGNNGPVQTLVNTHWHPEQTGLNETVGKAGKTILAQENTRLWLGSTVICPWNGRRFKR